MFCDLFEDNSQRTKGSTVKDNKGETKSALGQRSKSLAVGQPYLERSKKKKQSLEESREETKQDMFSVRCDAGTMDYNVSKYKESFKKVTSLTQRGKSFLMSKTITNPSNTKHTMDDTQHAGKSNDE